MLHAVLGNGRISPPLFCWPNAVRDNDKIRGSFGCLLLLLLFIFPMLSWSSFLTLTFSQLYSENVTSVTNVGRLTLKIFLPAH